MATLRRLRWVFEADTRDFDRSMGRVQRSFRRLARVGTRGLAVLGGTQLVRGALNTLDALGKMADAAGVSVEALQELRFVADLAGISTQRFDESLLAFNRRLGELQLRGGPLFSFLKDYDRNLLLLLMRTQDTTDAFTLFAEAVRRAPTTQIQAALTAAGVGRGGLRMTNLLRGGAAGIVGGRLQARDQLSIVTEEMVRRAERLGDAQTKAQERLNTAILTGLARIGGFVETAMTNLDGYIDELRGSFFGNLLRRGRDFILN